MRGLGWLFSLYITHWKKKFSLNPVAYLILHPPNCSDEPITFTGKLKVWKYQEQDCSTVLEHVNIHFHIIKAPADELETKLEEDHAFLLRANKQKVSQQRVHLLTCAFASLDQNNLPSLPAAVKSLKQRGKWEWQASDIYTVAFKNKDPVSSLPKSYCSNLELVMTIHVSARRKADCIPSCPRLSGQTTG